MDQRVEKTEIGVSPDDYEKCIGAELGRLIRSLHEKCPDCGNALQVRARRSTQLVLGVENTCEITYKYCSRCHFESDMEQKQRQLRADRTAQKEETGGNDGYKNRAGASKSNGDNGHRGYRKRHNRNPKSL